MTATFKGFRLPTGEKSLKIQDNSGATYVVEVFEEFSKSSKSSTWRARIVGAGLRLRVCAGSAETAKAKAAAFFDQQLTDWNAQPEAVPTVQNPS